MDWYDLTEFLDSLPNPVTLKERILCFISNLVDDFSLLLYRIRNVFYRQGGERNGFNEKTR